MKLRFDIEPVQQARPRATRFGRGKRWYILSMNMMLKTVSLVNQPIGYLGGKTERDVPMEEIGITSKRGDTHGDEKWP